MYVSAEEIEGLMNEISGYELYAVSHSEFVDVFGDLTLPEWIGCACLVMILFLVFSAWCPAYKVARVNPVEAMREE